MDPITQGCQGLSYLGFRNTEIQINFYRHGRIDAFIIWTRIDKKRCLRGFGFLQTLEFASLFTCFRKPQDILDKGFMFRMQARRPSFYSFLLPGT